MFLSELKLETYDPFLTHSQMTNFWMRPNSKHKLTTLNNKKIIFFVFDRGENIVGKGENAGNQYFLLFPQCFQKPCFQGASKGVVWEWVKLF